jgi:hypothetical protein
MFATRRSSAWGSFVVHVQLPDALTIGVRIERATRLTAVPRREASAAASSSLSTAESCRRCSDASGSKLSHPTPVMTIRANGVFAPTIAVSPPWTLKDLTMMSPNHG